MVRDWLNFVREGLAALGNNLNGVTLLRAQIANAGFIDIQETRLRCPLEVVAQKSDAQISRAVLADGNGGWTHECLKAAVGKWFRLVGTRN